MRWLWTAIKVVVAGVALTGCLLIFSVALVLPSRNVHLIALIIGGVTAVGFYAVANRQLAALDQPAPKPRLQWRGERLVLEVDAVPERPSAVHYWLLSSLPGAHYGRGKVSLPLMLMHTDPDEVLAAAQELWQRNQGGVSAVLHGKGNLRICN